MHDIEEPCYNVHRSNKLFQNAKQMLKYAKQCFKNANKFLNRLNNVLKIKELHHIGHILYILLTVNLNYLILIV